MSKQYAFPIGNPGVKSLRLMNFRHRRNCRLFGLSERSSFMLNVPSSSGFKHDVVQKKLFHVQCREEVKLKLR